MAMRLAPDPMKPAGPTLSSRTLARWPVIGGVMLAVGAVVTAVRVVG